MSAYLIICLLNVICRADAAAVSEYTQVASAPESTLLVQRGYSLPEDTETLSARGIQQAVGEKRQRLLIKRFLQEQIKVWRSQAREMPMHLAEQALKKKPQVSEINIGSVELSEDTLELTNMVRRNTRDVVLQFVREMKIRVDTWEQAYVGRGLVALLERSYDDRLAEQDRLLVQVLVSGPRTVGELPKPGIKFPPGRAETSVRFDPKERNNDQDMDKNSESYLQNLRRAQKDAKNRNAADEEIMWGNRAVKAFYSDYTSLLTRTKSSYVNRALLARLSQQLRSRDAAFEQTLAAIGKLALNQMELRELKLMQSKLKNLARQSRGSRKYTDYTQVSKQVQTQSSFKQRDLDFSESVKELLIQLTEQIESQSKLELPDRRERTSGEAEPTEILERTPGPDD